MRLLTVVGLLAAFAGSSAFAQGDYMHHKWCLDKGSSQECAYDTLAQMQSIRRPAR
jgi:hypothetical protein